MYFLVFCGPLCNLFGGVCVLCILPKCIYICTVTCTVSFSLIQVHLIKKKPCEASNGTLPSVQALHGRPLQCKNGGDRTIKGGLPNMEPNLHEFFHHSYDQQPVVSTLHACMPCTRPDQAKKRQSCKQGNETGWHGRSRAPPGPCRRQL